jgi:hypothetical protein
MKGKVIMIFHHFLIALLLSSVVIPSATFAQDAPATTIGPKVAPTIVRPAISVEVVTRVNSCLRPKEAQKYLGDLGDNWSVGPGVSAQLLKYDLASKQVSFNRSIGVGASFRYFSAIEINGEKLKVSDIKPECRATSFSASDVFDDATNGKLIANLFSITPTLYATQAENSDLSVQPAILLGLFRDILNFGTGFNLTGPDKGHAFLLFSIGSGFNF